MKHPAPTTAEMDGLIACLPLIYGNGPVVIEERGDGSPEEPRILKMSYPVYSDEIRHVFKLAAAEAWQDPEYSTKDVPAMLADPHFIMRASVDDIRTMLTHCVRGERFSPGYRAGVVKSGQLRQILERLVVIRAMADGDQEDKFHQELEVSQPQCYTCVHWVRDTSACKAYPDGILVGIMSGDLDHRESLPGDGGITYQPIAP